MAQATDLQRLVVSLKARIDKFDKTMAKAAQTSDRTARKIAKDFATLEGKLSAVGRNLKGIFTGIVASGAIRALGQAVDKIANIGEIAGRIGVTTKALQAMYSISKRTGASLEEMDRALQAIAEQSAESGSFLQKLFVTNKKPLSKNVEDNLRTVMDLLKDASNEQERLSIATKLWGDRLGRGLVEAFSQGGAAIDATFADLLAHGQAHSEAQIKEAQKIRDAYRLYMDDIALGWQRAVVKMLEATGVFADQSEDALKKQIEETNATLTKLLAERDRTIMEGQGWFGKSVEQLSAEIALLETRLRSLRALLKADTAAPATSIGGGTGTIIPTEPGAGREAIELDDAMKKLIEDMDDARDSAKGFASDLIGGLREGLSLTEALGKAFQNLADKLLDRALDMAIDQLLGERGTAGTGLLGQALGVTLKDQSRLGGSAPDVAGPTAAVIPVAQEILRTVARKAQPPAVRTPPVDLTDADAKVMAVEELLGLSPKIPTIPVTESILKSIARHPAYSQIAPSPADPLGDIGDLLGLLRSFLGGGLAEGGLAMPGRPVLVGEKGPEVIMPKVPSIVSPMGRGGGGTPHFVVEAKPNPYFDIRVRQISGHGDAQTLNSAKKNYPMTAARFQKLGTT